MNIYRLAYRLLSKIAFTKFLNDKSFIRFQYRALTGYTLDLNNPKRYNEKLQWMKLYDRNPLYTKLVDKHEVKTWVANRIGEEYVIKTLGVWENVSDIKWDALPKRFVLKATHYGDNLGVVICKDKEDFDKEKACNSLTEAMKKDYYQNGREWPYKDVPRKIIAEEYKEDEYGELRDYKFFCFDGEVKAMFVATDRSKGHVCFDYFDKDFNHLDFIQSHPQSSRPITKPNGYDEMIRIAEQLSNGFPHMRVDLYNCSGKIYFGEITLFHYGGCVLFHPDSWDYTFGDWLKLPKTNEL